MPENNWKRLWSDRSADEAALHSSDPEKIFMELKRSSGFDVVKDKLSYQSFLDWYSDIKEKLCRHAPAGEAIQSVYEVGCGSGANLFLFERDGLECGGLDYSARMLSCAKQVLRTADIRCADACDLPVEPQYDAVISASVFGYFTDEAYAETVLEKMCRKARHSIGVLDIADVEKQEAYLQYRRQSIPNYEERYKGLPRLFFDKAFFTAFAHRHGLEIEISPVELKNYWNSQFYFDCYLYKH